MPPGPAVALPPLLPPPPPRGRRRSFRRYPLSALPPGPALRRSRAERRSVPTCRRRARAPPPGPAAAAAARGAPQRPARARCRAAGPWRRAAVTRVLGRGRAAAGGSGAPGAALGPAPCPAPLLPPAGAAKMEPAPPALPPPLPSPRPGVSHRRPALPPTRSRSGRSGAASGSGAGARQTPWRLDPARGNGPVIAPRRGRRARRDAGGRAAAGRAGRRRPDPVGGSGRGSAGPALLPWAAGPGSLRAVLRACRAGPPPPAVRPEPAARPRAGGWRRRAALGLSGSGGPAAGPAA